MRNINRTVDFFRTNSLLVQQRVHLVRHFGAYFLLKLPVYVAGKSDVVRAVLVAVLDCAQVEISAPERVYSRENEQPRRQQRYLLRESVLGYQHSEQRRGYRRHANR